MRRTRTLLPALCAVLAVHILAASGPAADAMQGQRQKRFNDLKFGMFIHWGPYSVASVEASWPIMTPGTWGITEADYRALPERFNPVHFDPAAWVRLAREAGQRYIVFTTKHHDGFCMFDSQYTAYKITRTPYGKDVVAMLADAARAQKMPLGFYYSPPDMHHPGYRDTSKGAAVNWRGEPERPEWPLYLDYMELQLRELLSRYGDVFAIWFDGLDNQQKYAGPRFHDLIRREQPMTLVNNRIGLTGDFVTPEQRMPRGIPVKGATVGYVDPDDRGISPTAPRPQDFQPWETCMTINETWAYNRNDRKFKSSTALIRTLVETASKGGNFLLNVGPSPDGLIQPEFEQRLRDIGAWLKVNGESIYGTTYGPIQDLGFGRMTARGNILYLHVFEAPGESVELKPLAGRVAAVQALDGGKPVAFAQKGPVLQIRTGGVPLNPHATVLRITMR